MNPHPRLQKTLIVLAIISLCIVIICGAFTVNVFDKSFYKDTQEKYNVYHRLDVNETAGREQAQAMTTNVLNYLHGTEELHHFNQDEQQHMRDVKGVVSWISTIYYSATIIFIILFILLAILAKKTANHPPHAPRKDEHTFIHQTGTIAFVSGCIVLGGMFLLLLASVFAFDATFILMHLIVFPQGNWMFPAESVLITIFPEGLFADIAIRITIYACVQAAVFTIIGWWIKKQLRDANNLIKK